MEGVPIRNARRGDIPSLLLLWTALMEEVAQADPRLRPHPRAREHMMAQLSEWLQAPGRILVVAEEGGRLVVGFASAVVEATGGWVAPSRVGRVQDCYVVPPRRRHGIGRRLVGRTLDLLYEAGAEAARVTVPAKHPGSRAFWDALGWSDLETLVERPAPVPPAAEA